MLYRYISCLLNLGVDWFGSDTTDVYQTSLDITDVPTDPVLYICGLSFSAIRVNGQPISDFILASAPWAKSYIYNGFSAVSLSPYLVANTKNTITVTLGDDYRDAVRFKDINPPPGVNHADDHSKIMRAQVRLSATTQANLTWNTAQGPVMQSSVYDGEEYDGSVDINTLVWSPAPVLDADHTPAGIMVPWAAPHIQVSRRTAPINITTPQPNLFVVDFGSNLAGVIKIKNLTKCAKGEILVFKHAEIMQHAGLPDITPDPTMIYQDNLRGAKATDTYK